MPFVDAFAFAENEDYSLFPEDAEAGIEGFVVGAQVFHPFTHAVYGQDADGMQEAADERAYKHIAPGQ